MGILDAPGIDAVYGKPTAAFNAARDLPNVVGYWDANTLTGSTGAAVSRLADLSGNGNHMLQDTTAKQPTIASGPNGRKVLALGASGYMARTTLGNGDFMAPAVYAQPLTFAAAVKAPAGTPSATNEQYILASNGSPLSALASATTTGNPYVYGGSVTGGGPNLLDGNWHVLVGVLGTNFTALFVDGYEVAGTLASSGAGTVLGLVLGAQNAGGKPFVNGQIGKALLCNATLTPQQIAKLSASWGAEFGVTPATQQAPPTLQDATSPNGSAVRIWEPPVLTSGAPLVLYAHNYTGSQAVTPSAGTWIYPLIMASVAEGWRVAASNQHGNSWGNQSAIDDLVDLYTMMNTRQAVTKVLVVGSSMGGLSAALSVPDGRMPVKGIALQDAVTNLAKVNAPSAGFTDYSATIATAYSVSAGTLSAAASAGATSISSSVSYANGTSLLLDRTGANPEIVTVNGAPTGAGPFTIPVTALANAHASGSYVSDYPTKTSGHDPNLRSASDYTGVRWRIYQSSGDASNVSPTDNGNAFATKIAAAPEAGVVSHFGVHLASDVQNPADFIAFAKRCFA